jgi:hypothetical protein
VICTTYLHVLEAPFNRVVMAEYQKHCKVDLVSVASTIHKCLQWLTIIPNKMIQLNPDLGRRFKDPPVLEIPLKLKLVQLSNGNNRATATGRRMAANRPIEASRAHTGKEDYNKPVLKSPTRFVQCLDAPISRSSVARHLIGNFHI